MRLPRDVSSQALETALRRVFGYSLTRQTGSHRRLTSQVNGTHHVTIPAHNPLKLGTLRSILREISTHHGLSIEHLIKQLNL